MQGERDVCEKEVGNAERKREDERVRQKVGVIHRFTEKRREERRDEE